MKKILMIIAVAGAFLLSTVCSSASGQNKKPETTKAVAVPIGVQLIGTKWKLVELHGQPVVKKTQKKEDSYLRLTKEGSIAAYGGCNNMTGSYTIHNGIHIKFSNIILTKMACPDMQTEQILVQVLQSAENYSIKGKRLTLGKTGAAPLAIFEATEEK